MPKPKQKKEKLAYLRHVPNLVTNTFLMATPNPTPNLIIFSQTNMFKTSQNFLNKK
jgi:hypothetical protein